MGQCREPTDSVTFDAAVPETWQTVLDAAQQDVDDVTDKVIKIAQDDTRDAEIRLEAISLLARIETAQSLQFLISNIELHLEIVITGDEDSLRSTPCCYAMQQWGTWKTAQAVVESLDTEKSDQARMLLGFVLRSCLRSRRLAAAVVDEQLARPDLTPIREQNLKEIRRWVAPR